jgi:hypothetical protein
MCKKRMEFLCDLNAVYRFTISSKLEVFSQIATVCLAAQRRALPARGLPGRHVPPGVGRGQQTRSGFKKSVKACSSFSH